MNNFPLCYISFVQLACVQYTFSFWNMWMVYVCVGYIRKQHSLLKTAVFSANCAFRTECTTLFICIGTFMCTTHRASYIIGENPKETKIILNEKQKKIKNRHNNNSNDSNKKATTTACTIVIPNGTNVQTKIANRINHSQCCCCIQYVAL